MAVTVAGLIEIARARVSGVIRDVARAERVGIVVDEPVRCVLVRHGKTVWSGEAVLGDTRPADIVDECVRSLPTSRTKRATVIALGPKWTQLRRLRELPPVADQRAIRLLIAQSAGRFFLRNGIPLLTTGVSWTGPREGWSAAFEEPIVRELQQRCSTRNLSLAAVLPAASYQSVAALVNVAGREPLAWYPQQVARPVSPVRLGIAIAAAFASALIAFAAPGLAAITEMRSIARERRSLGVSATANEAAMSSSARRFLAAARPVTLFLRDFTRQLPKEAFLVSLRTDSVGGTAIAIAPAADRVLLAMTSLPAVASAEVLGAVNREMVAGEPYERFALRFTWSRM